MVDFAQRNAERAGWRRRGGSFAAAMLCSAHATRADPGVMLLNPPYNERIAVGGVAGSSQRGARFVPQSGARERAVVQGRRRRGQRILQPSGHPLEKNFPGWTAWVLTPDSSSRQDAAEGTGACR